MHEHDSQACSEYVMSGRPRGLVGKRVVVAGRLARVQRPAVVRAGGRLRWSKLSHVVVFEDGDVPTVVLNRVLAACEVVDRSSFTYRPGDMEAAA